MDLTKYSEQMNGLLMLAYNIGEDFANFVIALFEDPGKLGPLALDERKIITTGTGDRVIDFEFGEAGNKVVSALRAVKVEVQWFHGVISSVSLILFCLIIISSKNVPSCVLVEG